MGAPDSPVRHRTGTIGCPVRRHVTQSLGFWSNWLLVPLFACGIGQSSGAPDSPVPLWPAALTSAVYCIPLFTLLESTVACWIDVARWHTGQFGGTPYSPVNYSEARLRFPESGWLDPV
jgi:hypothetical protein